MKLDVRDQLKNLENLGLAVPELQDALPLLSVSAMHLHEIVDVPHIDEHTAYDFKKKLFGDFLFEAARVASILNVNPGACLLEAQKRVNDRCGEVSKKLQAKEFVKSLWEETK